MPLPWLIHPDQDCDDYLYIPFHFPWAISCCREEEIQRAIQWLLSAVITSIAKNCGVEYHTPWGTLGTVIQRIWRSHMTPARRLHPSNHSWYTTRVSIQQPRNKYIYTTKALDMIAHLETSQPGRWPYSLDLILYHPNPTKTGFVCCSNETPSQLQCGSTCPGKHLRVNRNVFFRTTHLGDIWYRTMPIYHPISPVANICNYTCIDW